ncbi:MAG: MFS transporter, partial [Acidobacteriales bacterium]|nr:MFS transporter [Terriglobales bacterium]
WLSLHYGWRAAFVVTGAAGLLWVAAWFAWYDLPERHPRIAARELQLIRAETGDEKSSIGTIVVRWVDFFRFPQMWGLLVARIISDPVWWFYLFWLPKYLTESRGLSMQQMGMVVWIPYLASDLGSVMGGWYSGRLIAQGHSVLASRKSVMLFSALLMPVGVALVLQPPTPVTLFLISLVLCVHSAWKTNLITLTVDIFPRSVVASVHGLVAAGGGIGGAIFTALAGYLIEWGSYTPVLVLMGFLHPVAYLCVRWLLNEEAALSDLLRMPAITDDSAIRR